MSATKHNHPMLFGKREAGCPRCAELEAGAPVRTQPWREARRFNEEIRKRSISAHFAPGGPHARGACGPVCTFGDW